MRGQAQLEGHLLDGGLLERSWGAVPWALVEPEGGPPGMWGLAPVPGGD